MKLSNNDTLKLLFPIGTFFPAQRGPANTLYWHTKALYRKGIIPLIVTTNNHITDKHLKLNEIIQNEVGNVIYTEEKNYKLPKKLISIMIKEIKKSDIIHLSSLLYPPSLIAAFFARFYNKKIVWSVRGELESGAIQNKSKLKKVYIFLINLLINNDTIFHATSEKELQNIKNFFPKSKIVLLPNYIELPNKLDNINTKKQILFLGRINKIKALENLIEALSKSDNFLKSEFTLKIVGPVDDNNYLKELEEQTLRLKLKEKIVFLEKVEGTDKQKLLAESYFLVLPSHSENFGNVILESLSQSTPVIASNGTPWKNLDKEGIGFYVNNSPESLSRTIDNIIILNEIDYKKMREKSYQYVKENFSVHDNIQNWVKTYKKILNNDFIGDINDK